jgi:hypothetical protein
MTERSQEIAPLRERELPSETFMEVYWHFRLNKSDALLVLKALGGRLKPAEVEQAKELADYLTELRLRNGTEAIKGLQQAYANMLKDMVKEREDDQS